MTKQVQICIPEDELDNPMWGEAVEYDQAIGRMVNNTGTLVNINGETLSFPASWIKRYRPTP